MLPEPQVTAREAREIAVHALLAAHNCRPAELHPGAEEVLRRSSAFGWADVAATSLELAYGSVPVDRSDGYGLIIKALSTGDFPSITAETLRGISEARQSDQLDDITAITRDFVLRNYQAESFSFVDIQNQPQPSENSMQNYFHAEVISGGEEIRVYSTFAKFLVPRQMLTNDDRNFIAACVNAFAATAHRREIEKIAELLEATSTLSDGQQLFIASNSLSSTALDASGLASAFSKLRLQPTESGELSGAQPYAVAVHPDDEFATLALIETLPEGRRPRVVVLPDLTNNDDYFVLGSPSSHPVIGRSRLDGSDRTAVNFSAFEPASMLDPETNQPKSFPGVMLPASHSVGLNVLGRVGAVRVSKT